MARAEQVSTPTRPRPWLLRNLTGSVALELVIVAIVLGALSGRWWGYAIAAVLFTLGCVLAIPMNGSTLWRRLQLSLAHSRRRPVRHVPVDMPTDLVPLAQWVPELSVGTTTDGRGGGDIGVVSDGEAWTAVLALTSDDALMSDAWSEIDLDGLVGMNRQDDVVFAGVQVLTYTVPAPTESLLGPDSLAAQAYREITADAPPPTVRKTWLCVRLDPRQCLEAVARRGTGSDGIHSTLRFGLHRVQTALKRQGLDTRTLSPLELSEVLALCSGAGPEHDDPRSAEHWSSWTCDGVTHVGAPVASFGRSPSVGYQSVLDAVSGAPLLYAVTSFTLSPLHGATGAIRVAAPNLAEANQAMTRVREKLRGTVRIAPAGGTQVPIVLGTVPLGREVSA